MGIAVTPTAYRVHRTLTSLPVAEVSIEELAEQLRLSKSAILRAIQELEDAGLVSVAEDGG